MHKEQYGEYAYWCWGVKGWVSYVTEWCICSFSVLYISTQKTSRRWKKASEEKEISDHNIRQQSLHVDLLMVPCK